ncbi:hypothetical protein KFK09_020411 [Dendrobium nobile]|uniref:Uncharacterized protein n=1 Tax=Dendrobium nobile TaxID=94219 RepID=A0A8T3AL93_DENNO|nr:hypothetical protein KFK09_020411 [Dendrobium nobile]
MVGPSLCLFGSVAIWAAVGCFAISWILFAGSRSVISTFSGFCFFFVAGLVFHGLPVSFLENHVLLCPVDCKIGVDNYCGELFVSFLVSPFFGCFPLSTLKCS